MTTNHPLTLTVEQAARVLGIGRSTAYELVRTGDLKCIHLRRRIVIPVAHLADALGVSQSQVRTAAQGDQPPRPDLQLEPWDPRTGPSGDACRSDQLAMF